MTWAQDISSAITGFGNDLVGIRSAVIDVRNKVRPPQPAPAANSVQENSGVDIRLIYGALALAFVVILYKLRGA